MSIDFGYLWLIWRGEIRGAPLPAVDFAHLGASLLLRSWARTEPAALVLDRRVGAVLGRVDGRNPH